MDIPPADLAGLAAEVSTLYCHQWQYPDSELLDIPAGIYYQGNDLILRMLQAKCADLLMRCADILHTNLLLIADAAGSPRDASQTGQALVYRVK